MRVALDIDDTITLHPEFIAFLSNALLAAGHGVYIGSRDAAAFSGARDGVDAHAGLPSVTTHSRSG